MCVCVCVCVCEFVCVCVCKVPFGKQTMEPISVGVAFASGVRLEVDSQKQKSMSRMYYVVALWRLRVVESEPF